MVHMSRSEQKRISYQKRQRTDRPAAPYQRDKREVEQYIDALNKGYANGSKK